MHMQDSDTGITTIFMYRYIVYHIILQCIDLNMTCILIILKVQVRLFSWHCSRIGLEKKVGMFCKKMLHFALYVQVSQLIILIFLDNASMFLNSVWFHL